MEQYNFAVDVASFVKQTIEDADDVVRRVISQTAFSVIDEAPSPVGDPSTWSYPAPPDYTPGHFLLNWQLGVDNVPTNELNSEDPDRANALIRIGAQIPAKSAGHDYYLVNNASYARALEDGHSDQCPPRGMVERTSMKFESIVDHAVLGASKSNK